MRHLLLHDSKMSQVQLLGPLQMKPVTRHYKSKLKKLHSSHITVNITLDTNHCTHLNVHNLAKFGKVIIEVRDIVQTAGYFLQFQRAIVWVLVTWSQASEVKRWFLCWLWRIFGLEKKRKQELIEPSFLLFRLLPLQILYIIYGNIKL